MDAKVKKVLSHMLKKGGEHEAFDMSIALKMDENFVEKALDMLSRSNLVVCRRDEKNNAFWSAASGAAAAAGGGSAPKTKKAKNDDGSAASDDDSSDDFPKKAPCPITGHAIAAVASIIIAVALSMVLGGADGKIKAAEAKIKEDCTQTIQAFKNETNEKITKLEEENTALKARADSLGTVVSRLSRPAPAAARPAAGANRRR